MTFAYLEGSRATLASRLGGRRGHFMPPSLLDSQLAILEPPVADESAIAVSVELPLDDVVDSVLNRLSLVPGPPA